MNVYHFIQIHRLCDLEKWPRNSKHVEKAVPENFGSVTIVKFTLMTLGHTYTWLAMR